MKKGPELSPAVVVIAIVAVVAVLGFFLWNSTGKKTAVIQDREAFKAAYEKANSSRPGNPGGGGGSQMQDAMNRMRSGQSGTSGGQ